jgi:regulator of sigma E protease
MSVVYFLLLVGVLVLIHELGHFAAAKILGIGVLRFSLGFGTPLVRIRGRETEYQLAAIPLGGYVQLLGETAEDPVKPEHLHRALRGRPLWQQAVVFLAGPLANFLLPVLIYFVFFFGQGRLPAAIVGDVVPNSPAAKVGILPGDRVVSVNGESVRHWEDIERAVQNRESNTLRFDILRGDKRLRKTVEPVEGIYRSRDGRELKRGVIGITRDPSLPQVGVIDPRSAAAQAGLQTGDIVFAVDGRTVESFQRLLDILENRRRAYLSYLRPEPVAGVPGVELLTPQVADLVPQARANSLGNFDLEHGISSAEMFVSRVVTPSPAATAGLQAGDLIVGVDDRPVTSWLALDQLLQTRPQHTFQLRWLRANDNGVVEARSAPLKQTVHPGRDPFGVEHNRLLFGAHGNHAVGQPKMIPIAGRTSYALTRATARTAEAVGLLSSGAWSILRGKSPSTHIGGPLTMFQAASFSAQQGFESFLLVIALLSISVGLLNLLPIPVLDGGHFLLAILQTLKRRPLSSRVRDRMTLCGLILLVLIGILALKNDVVRYFL